MHYVNILFGLLVWPIMPIQMYVNIMCINNKMVQEWPCKEHQIGYDSTKGEEERGSMGKQTLASKCQL